MGAWMVIFLAGGVATIWNVSVVMEDYLKYAVDTSISINMNTVVCTEQLPRLSKINAQLLAC